MLYIITVTFLYYGYAVAQDADCDYRQNVTASELYYINNNYSAGRTCRYVATCLEGYNCRVDCNLYMPSSSGCSADRLLVSKNGDVQLTNADAYCGYRTVSAVSVGTDLVVGLVIPGTSSGGSIMCNLTAQMVPVTPTPAVCRCGERKQNRIVGGQETKVNEYPMMAAIIERAIGSIYCGCVIISNRFVMTAAHCVDNYRNKTQDLIIVAGAHNISDPNSGKRYDIRRFIIHDQYNSNTYDYDIALVELSTDIVFNDTSTHPVCLPFKFEYNYLTGAPVTFLGWGAESFGGPTYDVLQQVDVKVISEEQCTTTEDDVTERQICTYAPQKDACQMDSGGPALYTDPDTGLLFSVGIISNGNICGGSRPGKSTRVTQLLKWIVDSCGDTSFCIKR